MTFPLRAEHLEAAGVDRRKFDIFLTPLNAAMEEFEITRGERPAMFLAQVAHESGGFRWLKEIWGPTPAQLRYPDGRQWAGHGLIQITHKANHIAEAEHFGVSIDDIVEWLQTPVGASRSAAHFWQAHGCNALADAFDFVGVTRKINGGINGLDDRLARYKAISEIA